MHDYLTIFCPSKFRIFERNKKILRATGVLHKRLFNYLEARIFLQRLWNADTRRRLMIFQ